MITNAPFMLNVDCDMFVNNPQIFLHAMCLLLGSKNERESGFVQCPQYFYDGLKDDPFGNQFVVGNKVSASIILSIRKKLQKLSLNYTKKSNIYWSLIGFECLNWLVHGAWSSWDSSSFL